MPGERVEERTLEVSKVPVGVDEELLSLYFENKRRSGGGPLVSVVKDGDRAIVVFEDAAVAARVLSKGHHVLHNAELSVRKPASKDPRKLLLRGINPNTNTEMIELYVENTMGLEDYNLYPSPGSDLILIQFYEPLATDFQTLSTQISKRTLDGAQVTVEQVEQPDSILVENLHPGTTPDHVTLYFESSRGGNQDVKEVIVLSESTAKVSFCNYESVDAVLALSHKLEGAKLSVKPYFDFLVPVESKTSQEVETSQDTTENSEEVNDIEMQTSPPTAASSSNHPPSEMALEPVAAPPPLPTKVEEVEVEEVKEEEAEEVMEDQSDDSDTITCHIALTDPGKHALFQHSTIQRDIKNTNPNVIIQTKDDGVYIEGPDRAQAEQVKQTIMDFLCNIAEAHFTLELEKAQFLARKDVKERLLQAMTQSGSSTLYTVSDSNITVTSLTQDSAKKACSFLKSQVCYFSMPMDQENECMLNCREWSEFLQTLSFCSVKVSERGGNIDVWTLTGMENEKQAAIMQFLTTPIERETVISMEPGMLKYIQIHCHQLLVDMDQVSIFPLEAEDNCGLKIHGHVVACQMAEEVLQGVVSSICTRTITVNTPGVARFLGEKECQSILNEMEAKFCVYISPKYVPWKPLPHQDIFEAAWQMMFHKNFPKMSAQELKSDSMQIDASNGGLLEEAKKIVSAIDERLVHSVPTSDQQENMDNVDLYTASDDPSSLMDQDSDVTAVDSDQNTASGLFFNNGALGHSSNLEEEAQLSLAIQYSMESSHWTPEDEEEQLQKALELSRNMSQKESSSNGADEIPQVHQPKKANINIPLKDAIEAANTIQLFVFAGYNCDLIRVDIAFGKKVSQRQVEEKIEHRNLRNMSEYYKTCLDIIKRKHAVEIQIQGTIITVSGFKDFVMGAVCDVKLLLEKISNSVPEREILNTVQWLRHDPISSVTAPYSPEATVFIENAFRKKLKKVDILLDNQPHTINFEKMQEHNIASGKSAQISRKLLELDDLGDSVPEDDYSVLSNFPEATKVDEESDEFQNVVKQFYETIQEYHSKIRIIQVEKLMNKLLYNQYKLKKASVLQRATYPQIERTLYHGTSESSVKEICVHGFNRSFCGKNATVYGQGVYFAVNSALSVQDQYSPPNADGYKFIFVSKVLTGDYTKGCHSIKTAPLKETGDIPLRYDSVTDNITKPSMFVIFNDTQAFPEYLITCQRIHR
ncbi:protein mono-ADP-ribosyltransferase PARP10 [Simochromis diagramma]|uniref:protein mono-ADP-ribosyltransferase PARP10 n=1 Tax=Simochromis diagramma TaxID=43689 RepID=UPI001A7ED537|nr:protein mono-ADP-ribosyltransferase PARP10 [Simochromis diagramma]